jgi:hypothetical protein
MTVSPNESAKLITLLVLVLVNHYLWFRHFSSAPRPAPRTRFDPTSFPTFTEIASYFGLCVWLVPFALFVSLSASDNVLPTMGSEAPSGIPGVSGDKRKRQGMAKAVVDGFRDWVGEAGNVLGWWRTERNTGF